MNGQSYRDLVLLGFFLILRICQHVGCNLLFGQQSLGLVILLVSDSRQYYETQWIRAMDDNHIRF